MSRQVLEVILGLTIFAIIFLVYLWLGNHLYNLYDAPFDTSIMMSYHGYKRGWFIENNEEPEFIDSNNKSVTDEKRNYYILKFLWWLAPPRLVAETYTQIEFAFLYTRAKYM